MYQPSMIPQDIRIAMATGKRVYATATDDATGESRGEVRVHSPQTVKDYDAHQGLTLSNYRIGEGVIRIHQA